MDNMAVAGEDPNCLQPDSIWKLARIRAWVPRDGLKPSGNGPWCIMETRFDTGRRGGTNVSWQMTTSWVEVGDSDGRWWMVE